MVQQLLIIQKSKQLVKNTYVNCVLIKIKTRPPFFLGKRMNFVWLTAFEVNFTLNINLLLENLEVYSMWPFTGLLDFLCISIKVTSHFSYSAQLHWHLGRINRQRKRTNCTDEKCGSQTCDNLHNTRTQVLYWLSLKKCQLIRVKQEDQDNYLQTVVSRPSVLGTVPSSLPLKG